MPKFADRCRFFMLSLSGLPRETGLTKTVEPSPPLSFPWLRPFPVPASSSVYSVYAKNNLTHIRSTFDILVFSLNAFLTLKKRILRKKCKKYLLFVSKVCVGGGGDPQTQNIHIERTWPKKVCFFFIGGRTERGEERVDRSSGAAGTGDYSSQIQTDRTDRCHGGSGKKDGVYRYLTFLESGILKCSGFSGSSNF